MPKLPEVTVGRATGQTPERSNTPTVAFGRATGEPASVNEIPRPQVSRNTLVFGAAETQLGPAAPSLAIRELTGARRQILLSQRALPYQGSIRFVSEMDIDEQKLVGYPRISQTVLGAKENETEMTGCWKDRFLGDVSEDNAMAIVRSEKPATFTDGALNVGFRRSSLTTARDLCDLFEDIVYSARVLRVTWMHLRRLGRMAKFEQNWLNPHDVEWKCTFKWIGRDEQIGLPSPAQSNLVGLSSALSSSYTDLQTSTNFDGVDLNPSVADAIDIGVGKIKRSILEVSETIETRVGAIPDTIAALRRSTSIAALVRDQAHNLIETIDGTVAAAMIIPGVPGARDLQALVGRGGEQVLRVVDKITGVEAQALVDPGASIAVACQSRAAVASARRVKHTAARQRLAALRAVDDDVIAVVLLKESHDLRDVAREQYGNPDDWDQIRRFNGLRSSSAPPGTVIFVPVVRAAL